jgi:hypothetical protein
VLLLIIVLLQVGVKLLAQLSRAVHVSELLARPQDRDRIFLSLSNNTEDAVDHTIQRFVVGIVNCPVFAEVPH